MLYIYDSINGNKQAVLNTAQGITITEEINGERSLSFESPYGDVKNRYITVNALIMCDYNGQFYRVEKFTASKQNPPTISVFCRHVFFDSEKIFVPSQDAIIGQYANAIFAEIWQNTDFVVMSDSELANLGMTAADTYTDLEAKNKATPYELTNALIDAISQGELYIDNKHIALVNEIGAGYEPLPLDVTKNMDNLTIDTDTSTLVTRLYPFGKNNLDLETDYGALYIDSPNIDKYGVIEGYMDFGAISDVDMLHERACWCFDSQNQNRIDVPYVTISGKYIDMSPINSKVRLPHLGQRVSVEGYENKRIIKIVWKPQTPYDTEITIGQVKKDLFYYFKQFNNATIEYNAKGKNPADNPEVKTTIVEVTKQEVVAADNIEAMSAFIDDLQVERIETNVKQFICRPNLTVNGDSVKWTDKEHTYKADSKVNIRGYIKMEGLTQKFVEVHLVVPANYDKITVNEMQPLTVNGRQLYFTSVAGTQAFEYLTFTAPKTKYPNLTGDQAAMYTVYIRKTEAEYIKMQQSFEWNVTDNTYYVKTVYGTGDESGNGKYYFVKDADSGRFVYTSRFDGKERGFKLLDDGSYYTNDGVHWYKFGSSLGGNVKIIDHAPTEADLTGEPTVLVRYDNTTTPVLNGGIGTLFNASNTYVEVPATGVITISPSVVTVYYGSTQQFTCNAEAVTWSVGGAKSSYTSISATGLLTVGANETSANLTVKAVSVVNPNRFAVADVALAAKPDTGGKLYLFNNGLTTESGGIAAQYYQSGAAVPFNFGVTITRSRSNTINSTTAAYFANAIDLSSYVKINIHIVSSSMAGSYDVVGYRASRTIVNNLNYTYQNIRAANDYTLSFDISNLTGEMYLALCATNGTVEIDKIWLE